MTRNLIKNIARKARSFLLPLSEGKSRDLTKDALTEWFSIKGDKTLRIDYDLDQHSLVFDLGGYEGQWASDIYAKYRSKILVFEPCNAFCENIRLRFARNPDITVYNYGLSKSQSRPKLFVQQDRSSVHVEPEGASCETVELRRALDFFRENKIQKIDLMKINIEGGEYDLLEHLIKIDWVKNIVNLQVQFHDFVNGAEERMREIQKELSRTHELTYQYHFVWENWRLKT